MLYEHSLGETLWPAPCRKTSQMMFLLGLTSSGSLSPFSNHPSGFIYLVQFIRYVKQKLVRFDGSLPCYSDLEISHSR